MATGVLGTADVSAASNTTVYTCPADNYAVVSLNIVNRGNQATAVRVAVAATATPTDDEWLEYETEVLSKGVLERTGIVMDAGKYLVIYSSQPNISAVAMGIETPTV